MSNVRLTTANTTDYLVQHYAFCPSRGAGRCILPIPARSLADGLSKDMFKLEIQRLMSTSIPAEATAQFGFWIAHPKMCKVEDIELRPDMPNPIFEDERGSFLNLWQPAEHPPVLDGSEWALETFQRFLAHLIPDETQRTWFLKWLANKYQHPQLRGVAVLMVAAYNTYGAGRGTLFRLLAKLFGDRFVRTIAWENIAGEGSQSQFNPWAAESIIVCVDEIGKKDGPGRHAQNRQIFETLKTKIDPGQDQMDINIKHLTAVKRRVFFSTIAATNNKDAIAIPPDDRRFTVLENGQKMDEAMRMDVNAAINDPAAVGRIALYLKTLNLEGFDPFIPLPTDIKREMTEQHIAPVDQAIAEVVAGFTGELFTTQQVEVSVREYLGPIEAARYTTTMIASKVGNMFPSVRAGNQRLESTAPNAKPIKYSVYAKDIASRNKWLRRSTAEIKNEVGMNGHPVTTFHFFPGGSQSPGKLPGVSLS